MPTAAAEVALGTGTQRLSNTQVIAKVRGALESVGMWEFAEVSTATLSGGQKQRLAIASALAQGPPKPKVQSPGPGHRHSCPHAQPPGPPPLPSASCMQATLRSYILSAHWRGHISAT